MKISVVTGNPKKDGLCYEITEQLLKGIQDAGASYSILNTNEIERCRVCNEGWGICRAENKCMYGSDGFDSLQEEIKNSDALCLITPVYWGEPAEGMKCFLDRLRRCEFGTKGILAEKPVLLIASPGGSGNGALSCLEQMDRFCRHTGAVVFDCVGINRWNRDYKETAVYNAGKALGSGRKAGISI